MTGGATGFPLVTGAAGFAGSHLVERLAAAHGAATGWFNPAGPGPDSSDKRVGWTAVDVLDATTMEQELVRLRPSAIFHCAGLPHVGEAWSQSARALQVNAYGTHLLLERVHRAGLDCPVVITGSALVYRPSDRPLREEDPLGPADPYGVSKLAQEIAGMRSRARALLARSFNHAGPRQPPSFVTSSFARQIAEIEAGRQEPVIHVGNLEARRDITDVRDTVRAYGMLAASGRPARPYNVCSGRAYRVGDLLETLLRLAKIRVRVQQDPDRMRPSDNPLVVGDPSRIAADTGWRAEIPIEQTLADLLDWWRGRHAHTGSLS